MKLLVAGSRSLDGPAVLGIIDQAWVALKRFLPELWNATVVSGGARGVDREAERWAKGRGLPFVEVPARWQEGGPPWVWRNGRRYNPNAGFDRNTVMVDQSDAAIVVWDGRSRGALDTINKVIAKQIPAVIFVTPRKGSDA